MPRPRGRGSHAALPARRRNVGECLHIPRHGRGGGLPVGHVRRRRRISDDAAADFRRDSRRGRRRHRNRADPCLIGVGRPGAMAAAQRRRQDGGRAAGRRPCRLHGRGAAGRRASARRCVRFLRRRLLRHLSGRDRHPDDDRKHQHHSPDPRRQGRLRAASGPAQLGARPAAQDALQPLQALHQRDSAGVARLIRRLAGGHHGRGRRLHHGAGNDLSAADADQCRGRNVAVPDRVPDRGHDGAACLAELQRRCRAGDDPDGGRGDRRPVRHRCRRASEGRAAALPARGLHPGGLRPLRLAADCNALRPLFPGAPGSA